MPAGAKMPPAAPSKMFRRDVPPAQLMSGHIGFGAFVERHAACGSEFFFSDPLGLFFLAKIERIASIAEKKTGVGRFLSGIRESDLGQAAQSHLARLAAEREAKCPAL
ncbi:MAG TPA: hypothetical protein VK653_11860 [Xanthobacteraceae bacterium]|nr:hypothetical protein [Xanthobacteraceae bacterium]